MVSLFSLHIRKTVSTRIEVIAPITAYWSSFGISSLKPKEPTYTVTIMRVM